MKNFIITLLAYQLIFIFISCDKSSTGSNSKKELKPNQIIQLSIKEPSGLTYSSENKTLFTVRDGNSGKIYELTTGGRVLRKIQTGSIDLEGITLNATRDTILVVEEKSRAIARYTLTGTLIDKIQVPLNPSEPNGLEGIAIHPITKHIFVVNEKKPRLLLELTAKGHLVATHSIDYADDLSGLCFDTNSNNLLLVSHESQSLFTIDLTGKMLSSWKIPVEKAEGVVRGQNGLLYIVCDRTSQLYIFELN